LTNRKYSVSEGPKVTKDDAALVNRFLSSATKHSFLDDALASPEQYLKVLTILSQVNLPGYGNNLGDSGVFREAILLWRTATSNLYKLMEQGNLKKRFAESKEALRGVVSTHKELNALLGQGKLAKSLKDSYEWMEGWDAVQYAVFDRCVTEFGVCVVLTL